MRVLVFDTETTGLPKTKIISPDTLDLWPFIVQFSYIIYDISSNKIVKSKDYKVKLPENILIPEESTKIHGITNEISRQFGVPIEQILIDFCSDVKTVDKLIGHNIVFDINMVKIELLRLIYNKTLSRRQLTSCKHDLYLITNFKDICCTLKDSVNFCNIQSIDKYGKMFLKYPTLSELHQKLFSISPNNLHNSFHDIIVTLRCYMKLKHDIDLFDNCDTFKKYCNILELI